jgi:AcrR family transcriptional regulator
MTRIVKKANERRQDILNAARKLFHTRDYDQITMQDLMEMLSIAKGTIYHYFSSKEELLEAVVDEMVDEEFSKAKELMTVSQHRNLDAIQKMRLLIEHANVAEDHEQIIDMLHRPSNIKMQLRQMGAYIVKLAPIYASVIEEGVQQGIFMTDHPLECAEYLLAAIQFLTDVGLYPWSDEQLTRRMAAIPALIEDQLQAPKGSFNFLVE